MEQRARSGLRGGLSAIFRGIDLARRLVFNLIFLLLLVVLVSLTWGDKGPEVPEKGALVISPVGNLVEQLAGDPVQRAVDKITGNETPETLMLDLVDGIRAAKDDDRIQVLVLDLDNLGGAGLTKLQVLRQELESFKASGKPIIATADNYTRNAYYLASMADEVYLHTMGLVLLDGFGRYRTYFKEGIDRLELDWNIFKVGTYKSAVEPYMLDGMSEAAREANQEWMGDLWTSFVADVAASRNMTSEQIEGYTDEVVSHLATAGGDTARMALDAGLVDTLGHRDEVRARLIELVGEDDETHSFHQVGLDAYLQALGNERPSRQQEDGDGTVALVVARGTILNGDQPPGTIGGDSTARLIRKARHDDDVKAIVLRVDSGGGSAFASEIIRRELALARQDGKKVVVSMGTVAASGGYWISTASDEIWASPNTITGSIGIFGMLPTYQKPLAKHLGMRVDGYGTNWMAGALRTDRAIDSRLAEVFQLGIERGYEEFLERVGEARNMSRDDVDAIAQGRVWSGIDAFDRGLVDQLGDLDQAIASAIKLAGMESAKVVTMEKELDWGERMVLDMSSRAAVWLAPHISHRAPSLADKLFATLEQHREMLSQFDDPNGVYAHCLCEVQ